MEQQMFSSQAISDNLKIAENIIEACKNKRIFAFYGELGAGKTTFIKSFCACLGVESTVTSPTFTLVQEYEYEEGEVYHFDFYRLKYPEEALEIGCGEYFDSGEYCLIEWPEKIATLLPEDAVKIHIEATERGSRSIRLTY